MTQEATEPVVQTKVCSLSTPLNPVNSKQRATVLIDDKQMSFQNGCRCRLSLAPKHATFMMRKYH